MTKIFSWLCCCKSQVVPEPEPLRPLHRQQVEEHSPIDQIAIQNIKLPFETPTPLAHRHREVKTRYFTEEEKEFVRRITLNQPKVENESEKIDKQNNLVDK
jgi:hypothetical protein